MALNMNQLAAITTPANDDIIHLRNTSGIDVKMTIANLHLFLNPIGTIKMFDGSGWVDNSTIPGWYACISANSGQSCPDLENQFIKGGSTTTVLDTGGSATHTLAKSEIPKHYHEIDHDHGSASTGAHTHPQRGMVTGIGSLTKISVDFTSDGEASYHATASTTPSINLPNWTGNSEDGSETGLNGEAHNNEPQYYKLIFIRKCS